MELFMFLWVIVLLPKTLQMVTLGAIVVIALWQCKGFEIDQWAKVLFAYILLFVASICINLFVEVHEASRIMAAINMVCIWCIAALYYIYFKNSSHVTFEKICRCCFINVSIMLLLVVAYAAIIKETNTYTVPGINAVLVYPEATPRFQGLMEYPTLVTIFIILQIAPACCYLKSKVHSSVLTIIYFALSFLPIYFSNSRSGYVLFFVAAFIFVVVFIYRQFGLRVIAGTAVGGLMIIAVFWSKIMSAATELIDKLVNMRSGSNNVRFAIYQYTFERTLESPIIGKGIKDICPTGYPYGSHCAYLGYFYKTGIIGLVMILTVLLGLLITMWMRKDKTMTYVFCLTFFTMIYGFCIFEDLDGANWLICVFFAMAGVMMNETVSWNINKKKGK